MFTSTRERAARAPSGVTEPETFRLFQTGLRIIETARRPRPARVPLATESFEFDDRPAIDSSRARRDSARRSRARGLRAEIARH
jgi:hypothetical protein